MPEKNKGHIIRRIVSGSIAEAVGIEPGDMLLRINGKKIEDIFDYRYLSNEEELVLSVQKASGKEWELEIEKEFEDDLGIEFEDGLMDKYRSCHNKCIFCFIDQMPPGMRETLYFKDDDARLSFLQGNYITLTNMNDKDVERVCFYKLSPINISIHTMNKELRCKMLNNRFAGEALEKMKKFRDADIRMNAQIVLCKGINDGKELDYSISELEKFLPQMKSVSVVPVGLTKYRKGLYQLEKFNSSDAAGIVQQISAWQERLQKKHGTRFVYASDEWYLMAGLPIPEEEYYEGYGQLENGVGMVRSLTEEVKTALNALKQKELPAKNQDNLEQASKTFKEVTKTFKEMSSEDLEEFSNEIPRKNSQKVSKEVSLATGILAAPVMRKLAEKVMEQYPFISVHIFPIINHFFGEDITVAGLVTGTDLIAQLTGKHLGEYLLLPSAMLRSEKDVFLDDITIEDVQTALQTKVRIVEPDGASFVNSILGV